MNVATDGLTGPIFSSFMAEALEGNENCPFERPEGIQTTTLDRYTGNRASENSESTVTDIFPSWYEPRESRGVETAVINSANNRLATSCTPESLREEVRSYGLQAEIPADDPAFSRWNPPVQALADRLDISTSSIPTEEDNCDDDEPVEISSFDASYDEDTEEITVTVQLRRGTYDIDDVQLRRTNPDETLPIQNTSGNGRNQTWSYVYDTGGADGTYEFEVTVIDEAGYSDSDSTSASSTAFAPGLRRRSIGVGSIVSILSMPYRNVYSLGS